MKVWKRCMAAVLAFMIFTTSVKFTEAAGIYDKENFIWTSKDAEVAAEHYGLDDLEKAVLLNPAVDGGAEYTFLAPYDNKTEGKSDLVMVDYENQCVYAKALHADGVSWIPTEAILTAAGEEEMIALTAGVCFYNDIEYYASGAFTYSGNSYKVNVIYQLYLDISAEEQTRILEIPQILAQTANNLEVSFYDLENDLADFIAMIPALNKMLGIEYTEITTEGTEQIETTVPLLDPIEDEESIESIKTLYQEYLENNENLILNNMREDYFLNYRGQSLAYALEKGAQLQEHSDSLLEHVYVLKDGNLSNQCNKLKDIDQELYNQLKNIRRTLRGLSGSVTKPGELTKLADSDNWRILEPTVQDSVFSDSYTAEDFASLEAEVYHLRNLELQMPSIDTENLLAAEIGVECEITYHEIAVAVSAETTSGTLGDEELYPLEPVTATVKLLEGSTADEIRQVIEDKGIERSALSLWNDLSSEYQINAINYDREESSIPKELRENVEYNVSYSPKKYTLKTNFDGNKKVPFGYQFELPIGDNQDISYDYVVELDNGTAASYSEGTKITVNQSMTVTQTKGTEKTEHRLYYFLANDTRYAMSDKVKELLLNTALISPTLKIRMPNTNKVSDVILENGNYYIKAENSSAGILGMTWEPQYACVMNGEKELLKVPFEDGIATWTEGEFTHVSVSYQLKIESVEGGLLGDRPLDETEDVLYALNLPHDLVTHTVKQNQLLSGTEGVTAKVLYQELSAVKDMMTPENLKTMKLLMNKETEQPQIKAIDRLMKDEKDGGAWNSAANKLALYAYLEACDNAGWSLAVYYEQGLYLKIAEQAKVVAECLEVINESESLWRMLNGGLLSPFKPKMEKLVAMLPGLKELAKEIEGPHKAINMQDDGYQELINLLISMEGETAPVEKSNGIYASETIRRNQGDTGTLTISVKVGAKPAQSRVLAYTMEEEKAHKLTEDEAEKIRKIIAELKKDSGLMEAEEIYYSCPPVSIPEAGDSVKKNAEISLVYSPRKYCVTIAGVPETEYKEEFKYIGDVKYSIALPPYSMEEDAKCMYIYWIDENTSIEVKNGTECFYEFTKEDLTTRLESGYFEILKREERALAVDVTAKVNLEDNLIKGYWQEVVDRENMNLYLDVQPEGIKEADFNKLVNFVADEGATVEVGSLTPNGAGQMSSDDMVINGSSLKCIVEKNGRESLTTVHIIILGDVNKSGKLDTNDLWTIAASYVGNMKNPISERDSVTQQAADVNRNGCYDSNDVWQILRKLNYWDTDQYSSVLAQ